jgi:hypothetical protein
MNGADVTFWCFTGDRQALPGTFGPVKRAGRRSRAFCIRKLITEEGSPGFHAQLGGEGWAALPDTPVICNY